MKTETKFITLKFDLMFKKVFGDENDLRPIRKLLKEILGINPKKIKILNNEKIGIPYRDKKIEVDLIVELSDGTKVNVEINTYEGKEIINRNVYYMCRNISKDLNSGYYYDKISKHIQINLDYKGIHTKPIMRYKLYDKSAKEELTDIMEIIRIDIPYYTKMCYNKDTKELDSLTRFIGMFGLEEKEEIKGICNGDEDMENIYKKVEEYNSDLDLMGAYDWEWHQKELKRLEIRDAKKEAIKEGLKEGREEGLKEGLKEGREEGRVEGLKEGKIEIAKNLLKKNIDINVILEVTNLSIEEINKLAN